MLSVCMCFNQNLVLVAEYHVELTNTEVTSASCDEFPVPQIDRKVKQVKTVT